MKNNLSSLRKQAGLSQEALSEKSGVSRVTISGIESGRVDVVKTDTLVKIADALNRPVTEIFFCA